MVLTFSRSGHVADAVYQCEQMNKAAVRRHEQGLNMDISYCDQTKQDTYAAEAVERWAASMGRTATANVGR